MNADDGGKAAAAALKSAARRRGLTARDAAQDPTGDAAQAAAARFLAAFAPEPGAAVAGYRPIRSELDPTPLMTALLERGAQICVPVVVAAGAPLIFRLWTPTTPMVKGAFGADVPPEGAPLLRPEVLITPLAAFDRDGRRVGYGGGFYDRTLEQLRAVTPGAFAVGFAYAAQETRRAPTETVDQPLDAVVTEREVIRCGPRDDGT